MERVGDIERMLLGLAEQTRLRILGILKDGEASVSTITERLGLAQPKVSRHLAYLKESGIALARRDGKQIFYRLADDLRSASIVMAVIRELDGVTPSDQRLSTSNTYGRPHISQRDEEMETYLL